MDKCPNVGSLITVEPENVIFRQLVQVVRMQSTEHLNEISHSVVIVHI